MAFIFGCFHDEQHVQWCEEHCESTEPESRQKAKMFFFFFFFKRAGSKFCDSFMIVFTQNSSILHWAVHQPIAFYDFEVSRLYWSVISVTIFKNCTHVHKSLSNKTIIIQVLYGCVQEDWESLLHPLLIQCLKRAWSMILQPVLNTYATKASSTSHKAGLVAYDNCWEKIPYTSP